MSIYYVLISLLGYVALYSWFSKKVNSWINVLTPHFTLSIPTHFLAEAFYLHATGSEGFDIGYIIIYSTYFLMVLFYALGYVYLKQPNWIYTYNTQVSYGWLTSTSFMVAGVILYYPVISEFSSSIFDPRSIYIATRTGYGLNYYISATLSYIFLILILFKSNYNIWKKSSALIFVLLFAYLHGSKGQVITTFFIWMLWYFVAEQRNVTFLKFISFSTVVGSLGILLFYSMLDSVNYEDLGLIIAGYADYSRNAVMLIEKENKIHLGRLFFEENFYSRIPRLLFENKPKDFGGFELAKKYFPESFSLDQGVPSFGIGIYFADFYLFAAVILSLASFIGGWMTRIMITRIKKYKSPIDFIVLLFLCGIVLLPIGSGYLLPEHIFFAALVYWICHFANKKLKW